MERLRSLEHLKAQLTLVRWHLDAATLDDGEKRRRHLDSANLTYQGALELFAQLPLQDHDRAALRAQLAQLAQRLRAAGQSG